MSQAMIIYNPSSGYRQGQQVADQLAEAIKSRFNEITLQATGKTGDATQFARQASDKGYHSIYLLGGDGTISEGVNGIIRSNHHPKVGALPLGTVNNFCCLLNIPLLPLAAVEAVSQASTRPIDIGRVNDQYFVSTVATGPIVEAVKSTEADLKDRFGILSYPIQGHRILQAQDTRPFKLSLDGDQVEGDFSALLIAMGKSAGGLVNLFPESPVDDGYMNVAVLRKTSPLEKLSLVPEVFKNQQPASDHLVVGRYKQVEIQTIDGSVLATNVDGDRGPDTPLHIQAEARALDFYYVKN